MAGQKDSLSYVDYLDARDRVQRLSLLDRLRDAGGYLPISLSEDLLCLDLGPEEKLAILENTGSKDGRALEHFLTSQLLSGAQDLAASAVRTWSHRTDHLLWFRVLESCSSPHISQRVLYTIMDHAFRAGGAHVVTAAAEVDGMESMSPAFHGLVLHRCLQWNLENPRASALAERIMGDLVRHIHPENKAMPSAIAYAARFAPEHLETMTNRADVGGPWRDHLRALAVQMAQVDKQLERLDKLRAKPAKQPTKGKGACVNQLETQWLPIWSRHLLSADQVAFAMTQAGDPKSGISMETFGGIDVAVLSEALAKVEDDGAFAAATQATLGYFAFPTAASLLTLMKTRLSTAKDPATLLSGLPLRLRVEMTESSAKPTNKTTPSVFSLVKQEEAQALAGGKSPKRVAFSDYRTDDPANPYIDSLEPADQVAARKRFFDIAYRGKNVTTAVSDTSTYWTQLVDSWQAPSEAKLATLASAARQMEGVFRLCYINTLGRFHGHDQAALKLLDFIRSKEHDDLRAVVHALGGIGTPRASQELVASLTRPNMSPPLQLVACSILAKHDIANLQNELRSALKDLSMIVTGSGIEPIGGGTFEVRDAIAGLIVPTATSKVSPLVAVASGSSPAISDQQLDQALAGKIPHYKELSSEVKRALRTSQFFHMQVSGDSAPDHIDLSPVIDMQYKALELLFRETFEDLCSRLIHKGILQRKLDVIGYARPIPRAMDEFEAYIASLPVIRDIPFFSKFKLRKMLRAICQFRPGKRFTLDGLKAFALFFLCFSRQECRYELNQLFPLGFPNDNQLYDFCKALHILQDFRNRAAHEGFHPDASNDIDGIWRQTAEIVQTMFKTKGALDAMVESEFAPKNRSTPIIEKKVS